jgi:serine/arginine repetitive matrix protein 2
VNGLRDEDFDSSYASRSSFASDNSMQQPADGVQVFFKEHSRSGSKGSNSSFLAHKKLFPGKTRPETKVQVECYHCVRFLTLPPQVFYSSSNQIGRLIENLSEGHEAGSFNFLPTKAPGHSYSSSFNSETDMHWTVEERLERMLGSMANP